MDDIKEMFPQIKIRQEDQSTIFVANQMSSMIFGVLCSPSSAKYVKCRNAEEFCRKFSDVYEAITERHYIYG